MDLDLSYNSQEPSSATLEIKSSLSYSCPKISGDMELAIFIPSDLKIKSWSKNELFSDFSYRISLPTTATDEITSSDLVYEISLLQRLLDEVQIQKLKNQPLAEIRGEIMIQSRHLAALLEEFFHTIPGESEIEMVVQIARKILRQEESLRLPGIKELDQHLSHLVETKGCVAAEGKSFVLRLSEIPVDVYSRHPIHSTRSAFVGKLTQQFTPDRVRVLNERNKEFGIFQDWFRVEDSRKLPSRMLKAIQGRGEKHDVLYFRRRFNLRSYLKNDCQCGIKEVLKFNLQKLIQPQPLQIYAYANISLSENEQVFFFRRQTSDFTAKFFKIVVGTSGIESVEQIT